MTARNLTERSFLLHPPASTGTSIDRTGTMQYLGPSVYEYLRTRE